MYVNPHVGRLRMSGVASDALRSAFDECIEVSTARKLRVAAVLRAVGMLLLAVASFGNVVAGLEITTLLTFALYSALLLLLSTQVGDVDAFPLLRRGEVAATVTEHWRDLSGADLVSLIRPCGRFERALDVSAAVQHRLGRAVRRHLAELGYPAGQVLEALQLARTDGELPLPELLRRAAAR